jgi:two-component system chemotaxis sensor kinase CheA
MIEDPDLRLMFKAECEERLYNLEQRLLQLEKQPGLSACMDDIFREAHSLKGLARMLNVKNMEQVAHHFETVLKAAIHGDRQLETEVIERLYHGVDDLRALAAEAITGKTYPKTLNDILGRLEANAPRCDTEATIPLPDSQIRAPDLQTLPNQPGTAENIVPELALEASKIETIRVGTVQLDSLMTHVSELTVNKNRLAQRLSDINDIIFLWDEWKQDIRHQHPSPELANLETRLQQLRDQLYEDNNRFDYLNNEIGSGIRAIRLLPLATTFNLFPRMVRDIAKQQNKQINLVIEGEDTVADKRVIEELKDPLMHLIRNAIDHAIEQPEQRREQGKPAHGTIRLSASQTSTTIVIAIKDDGAGINSEKIKQRALQNKLYPADELALMSERQLQELIFSQGFSTAEHINNISGRGLGMAIVRSKIEQLKGHIEIESISQQGTEIHLVLPITLATTKVIIIELQKRYYAVPVEAIELIRTASPEQVFTIDGCQTLLQENQAVSVARLNDLLELPESPPPKQWLAIIIAVKQGRVAVLVDKLVDEQEILLKPMGGILKRVRNISGVTVLGNGEVCIVLNPHDLVKTAYGKKTPPLAKTALPDIPDAPQKPRILYAEDSITTRTQIKRFLEKAGFLVTAAVDGRDAYEKLGDHHFAAVVSDVTMPNMDGLMLTEKIRRQARYQQLPIILLSAMDKADDRQRAFDLGASAYLSKSAFDQRLLLDALKNLI